MGKQHYEELMKSIELAGGGQWMPLAVLGVFFGMIIFLLLFIYKKDQKTSNARHKESEETLKQLAASNQKLTILVERHDVKIEILESR